jgi:AraC family transcriptional regulator of adaptative response / DNA-3-methyladenine glycosylase II
MLISLIVRPELWIVWQLSAMFISAWMVFPHHAQKLLRHPQACIERNISRTGSCDHVRKSLAFTLPFLYDSAMQTSSLYTDFDLCYKAMGSRDARFDGLFFAAVTTTGVYCRPICPAPMPHAQHVRFYPCAAAAEAAGFRACRRCHPEASPGSPDWNMRAELVARALRLIAEGLIDTEGVEGLARRLAVSPRHLHRELVTEVGVGPLALARTRRAQTARLLIDQTDLPLTTIAFTAGFASIRQFNETMQAAFGCAPSTFRRRTLPGNMGEGKLTLHLQYRSPFDLLSLLTYLERRAVPGVEEVVNGGYRRTICLSRSRGIIDLEAAEQVQTLRLRMQLNDLSDLSTLVQRCRSLFDLDAIPAAIADVLRTDPLLAPLVTARPGLRVPGTVSGEAIVQADLRGLGLTSSRRTALQGLAHAVVEEGLTLDRGADREHTIARLQQIPGVGPWTASYIAMRALGDPDAFPVGDLGLQRALSQQGLVTNVRSLERRAQSWRPWRAYGAHHLWASLSSPPSSKQVS